MLNRFRKLLEYLLLLLSPLIFLVDFLLPKNSEKMLFYGSLGRFTGNSKYLYQFIKNNREYRCIWLSRDSKEAGELREKYGADSVVYIEDFKGITFLLFHYLTAKVLVIQDRNNLWPLRRWTSSSRRVVIDVFHGIPLKKTGILVPCRDDPKIERAEIKKRDSTTYHTVPSDLVRYFLAACYSISVHKFPITGDPRNDALIDCLKDQGKIKERVINNCNVEVEFDHIILYAPTHRDPCMLEGSEKRRPEFFPFEDWSLEQLNNWLDNNSSILLLRTHNLENKMEKKVSEVSRVPEEIFASRRVFDCPHQVISDTNELLAGTSLLWTDYSGIYFDFLLTERPVVFIPYDLEEYREYRGLLFDYDLMTPGAKVNSMERLMDESKKCLLKTSNDQYTEKRQWIKKMYHDYTDGQACRRITRLIEEKI